MKWNLKLFEILFRAAPKLENNQWKIKNYFSSAIPAEVFRQSRSRIRGDEWISQPERADGKWRRRGEEHRGGTAKGATGNCQKDGTCLKLLLKWKSEMLFRCKTIWVKFKHLAAVINMQRAVCYKTSYTRNFWGRLSEFRILFGFHILENELFNRFCHEYQDWTRFLYRTVEKLKIPFCHCWLLKFAISSSLIDVLMLKGLTFN